MGSVATNTKKTTTPHEQSDYAQYDIPTLIYILKSYKTVDKALYASTLAEEMKEVLGESYSEKTLKRKLDRILEIQNWENEKNEDKRVEKKKLAEIMYCVYGGRIVAVGATKKKYYFEPCLDDGSMKMLNGTVVSNSFLSEEEKSYLLSRMKMLNMLEDCYDLEETGEEYNDLSAEKSDNTELPGGGNRFLFNTSHLNEAIEKRIQIEIKYGIYDISNNGIDFHPRNGESGEVKKYRINPYALFWNNGHYYLLATYVKDFAPNYMKEYGTPVNFRVDRVISVNPVRDKSDKSWAKRESIPSRLSEFFDSIGRDTENFKSSKYCATFPAMRISEKENRIECKFECTSWSLQILVDAFGTDIRVGKSYITHDKNELDYNNRPQEFIVATVKDVEFENARDFCLANPEYIRPISPTKLVSAVKSKLAAAAARLDKK